MPAMNSIYEKCREERIKENLQRMQNLGIMDLSLKLKSGTRPAKRRYTKAAASNPDLRSTPPLQLTVSTRRSSRLKDASPVRYFEEAEKKKGKASKEMVLWLPEGGERPEVYTDEHEKLLGNTERVWELFVDGYGPDGKRIYDSVKGKTCHQCRQKTLGHRTQCSKCHPSVTGQFCGDCLYMRYGEHVLETLENPDWICPGCRGICNCSLCRKRKGWLPTGNAYKKVRKLGYKSVAHYLILTKKQSETNEDDEADDTPSQASAKRSLSFKEAKASSEEGDGLILQITDGLEVQENHVDDGDEGANKNQGSARKSLSFLSGGDNQTSVIDGDDIKPLDVNEMDHPATPVEASSGDKEKGETKSKRKMSVEPNPNSIGGRLRLRRKSQV
uniref:Zinc-finger domain-containing protein n=2 Tax=Brassica campestris TaxID=3711 RepID=M4D5G8_BRACM